MSYYPRFGELLNNYLLERSASSLAKSLSVHPSTVAKWLSGDSRPKDPETVIRIADILGVHNSDERQKLMEAAGYAYIEAQDLPNKVKSQAVESQQRYAGKPSESISSMDSSDLLNGRQRTEEPEIETPIDAIPKNEQTSSTSSWTLQNRLGTVTGGLGLLLLISLGYPLLSDWPLGEIIFFGSVCALLLLLTIGAWYKSRLDIESLRHFGNHSRRGQIIMVSLLLATVLLWGAVGLPKLSGVWRYPSQNEDGDRFGHAVVIGDFNGDAYADLVIGTPGEAPGIISSARAGWIYTYYGTANRPDLGTNFGQAGLGLNEKGDLFGWSTAVGDFNGDGMDDLAVGAPGEARGSVYKAGYVFLYKGTEHGLVAWHGVGQDQLGSNEVNDSFGWALAAGDFNGDGLDDLAVGTPGETPGTTQKSGYVFVFTGTAQGLRHWFGYDQKTLSTNEQDDQFGAALASGDFDGDGVEDLAIGAPGEVSDNVVDGSPTGAVFVFRGNIHGLQEWIMLNQPTPTTSAYDAQFGRSLAVGDFNNDRKDDLAIGAPQAIPNEDLNGHQSGCVYIFHGASEGFTFSQSIDQAGLDNNEDGDQFGWAIATGNLNGDRNDELIVGAPGEVVESDISAPKSGYVYVFVANDSGFKPWVSLDQEILGHNDPGDLFGWALATGDFDNNGNDELVVGAPGEAISTDNRSGYVFIFRASTMGMTGWIGYHQE